jgi:uncharacterized membrane protein
VDRYYLKNMERMETTRQQARKLQSLIDNKHQFARSIDSCTRQLIQLVIGQSSATSTPPKEPYSPTKAVFQADLVSFAKAVFSTTTLPVISATSLPPSQQLSSESRTALIKALTDVVTQQVRQITQRVDNHHLESMESLNHLARLMENGQLMGNEHSEGEEEFSGGLQY